MQKDIKRATTARIIRIIKISRNTEIAIGHNFRFFQSTLQRVMSVPKCCPIVGVTLSGNRFAILLQYLHRIKTLVEIMLPFGFNKAGFFV